ncbi:MAG: hypothetical protein BKP49_09935 [Treponema sp. CETP13]|nr:MAG: hypothetical protein BKP49_09935 [Treponema sp. CETP13]
MKTIEDIWNEYLQKFNLPKSTPFAGECVFGGDEQESNEITAQVLAGTKQANCAALESYQIDMEPLPAEGNRYVVTNWNGNALCVIETLKVTILPFMEITWEMAQKESYSDSMALWEERQRQFFEDDADLMGYDFTPDTPVVFEEFCIRYSVAKE